MDRYGSSIVWSLWSCIGPIDVSSGGVERIEERKRIEDKDESSSCFSYRGEARMIRTIVRISIFTSEYTNEGIFR